MKRIILTTALVLATATGCGGSGDKASVSSSSSPTAASDGTPTPVSTADVGRASTKTCLKAKAELGNAEKAFTTADGTVDTKVFATVAEHLRGLKGSVPETKVKDALETLATAYDKLGTLLKGTTYKPGSGTPPPQYVEAAKTFSDPKFAAAGTVLSAYFSNPACK